MAEFIYGKTANDVWKMAAKKLLEKDDMVEGRTGAVFELLHTFVSIEDPRQKWIYSRIPPVSIAYALAELVWIMNGEDRADIINFWNPKLEKFAGKGKFYHGAYGKRIRSHFGFDQLESAYQALKSNPETRQVVIQIYDAEADFPMDGGQPRDADIPCNICSLLKIRNGKLEWSQIMRSNDVLLGMPYNFVQFTSLQEILAGWLDIGVGTYNHYSDSLHLYNRDIAKIGIGQNEEMLNEDSLAISKTASESIFREIYIRMKYFALNKVSEKELQDLSRLNSEYKAYNNIMIIIAAYVAQKNQSIQLSEELMKLCTNKLYAKMWDGWMHNKG